MGGYLLEHITLFIVLYQRIGKINRSLRIKKHSQVAWGIYVNEMVVSVGEQRIIRALSVRFFLFLIYRRILKNNYTSYIEKLVQPVTE